MRFRKSFLIFFASLLIAGLLSLLLAPFAVAAGLRFWIARTAEQEGLQIQFGKIDAPLLRPAVLHDLRVSNRSEAPFQLKIESPRLELGLNLSALFSNARGHVLRTFTADGISIDLRRNPQSADERFAWNAE